MRISKQSDDILVDTLTLTIRGMVKKDTIVLISTMIMLLLATTVGSSNLGMASTTEQYEFDYMWGSSGTGNGQLRITLGGDFDSQGNFYVVDYHNQRIQKFTEDGTFLKAWGGLCDALSNPDGCDGKFRFPRRLAVDSNDNVYVADTINERIQVFDSEGTFLRKTNLRTILGTSTLQQPQGIDVDNAGNIYVSTGNNLILKLNNAGNAILDRATAPLSDIALDPEANIIGLNPGFGTLYKLSSDLDITKSVPKADVQLKSPAALGVDSDGNVYVVDDINGTIDPTPDRIIKLTNNFEFVLKFADVGDSSATSTRVLQPADVAINDEGKIFVSDANWIKVYRLVQTNQPPIANAGVDQTVNEGDTVILNGTGSSGVDEGSTLSYQWTQIAGQTVSLSDSTSATPSFIAPAVGSELEAGQVLTFKLQVNDSLGGTSTDTVDIIVQNVNGVPTASLTATPSEISEGEISTLDSSASTDPDNDPLAYTFTILNSGPGTITGQSDINDGTVTYEAPPDVNSDQTVTIQVEVDDGNGGTGTETAQILVKDIPDTTPPVVTVPADIVEEATSADGSQITYEVTAQDDVDGPIDDVTCNPESGSSFPIGQTTVECSATDTAGNTGTGSFSVTIQDTIPPVISVPDDITEEATGPDGAVVSFAASAEDLVDGPVDVSCDHYSGETFPIGETVVICGAEDSTGNNAQQSFTITVQDTTAPRVEITGAEDRRGTEITDGGTTPTPYIRITFEATDVVGIDSRGTECSLDGEAFTSCTSPEVYDRLSRGTHEVTVRATDEAGNTGQDEFSWTVGPPASAAPVGEESPTREQ